jgi:helix-turn-helix protein
MLFRGCSRVRRTLDRDIEGLRVCTATVYRLCTADQLPHFLVGAAIRIREADLRVFGCTPPA